MVDMTLWMTLTRWLTWHFICLGRSKLLPMRTLLLITLSVLMSVPAFSQNADKMTFECSCSGMIQIAEQTRRGQVRYRQRQFMINIWQNTFVANNNLVNETHTFNRGGILSRGGKLKLIGLTSDMQYVLYENSEYFLKVPRATGGSVYFRQKTGGPVATQNEISGWQMLCPTEANEP
jgi:hypothetical protein